MSEPIHTKLLFIFLKGILYSPVRIDNLMENWGSTYKGYTCFSLLISNMMKDFYCSGFDFNITEDKQVKILENSRFSFSFDWANENEKKIIDFICKNNTHYFHLTERSRQNKFCSKYVSKYNKKIKKCIHNSFLDKNISTDRIFARFLAIILYDLRGRDPNYICPIFDDCLSIIRAVHSNFVLANKNEIDFQYSSDFLTNGIFYIIWDKWNIYEQYLPSTKCRKIFDS
jgi:hypothetical protein